MKSMKAWQTFIIGVLTGLIIGAVFMLILRNRNKMEVEFVQFTPVPTMISYKLQTPFVPTTTTQPGLININTATLEELDSLPGIGEAKAKSIIEFRNKNGSFHSYEDLLYVPGIGDAILQQIKQYISVN